MDYEDDNSGYGRQSRHNSGSRSHGRNSYSSSSGSYGSHSDNRTSEFDTSAIVGEDGSFFGFKLTPSMASAANLLFGQALPTFRRWVEKSGSETAVKIAEDYWKWDKKQALHFGNRAGQYIGYTTIGLPYFAEEIANLTQSAKAFGELRAAVSPLARAYGKDSQMDMLFGNGNEVISNARKKINSVLLQKTVETISHAIGSIPQIIIAYGDHKERQKALQDKHEAEYIFGGKATDKEMQEYLEKGMDKRWASEEIKNKQLKKLLKDKKEEYDKGYKAWIRKDGKKHLTEYQDGINNDRSSTRRDYEKRHGKGTYGTNNKLDDREKEKYLRGKYGEEHGFFNREDIPDHHSRHSVKETISEHMTKRYEQHYDEVMGRKDGKAKPEKETDENGKFIKEQSFVAAGSIFGEFASNVLGTSKSKELKTDIALDLILHLRRSIEENEQRDTIPGRGEKGEDLSYAQFVHKVFQQHQHDCRKAEIGERYTNNLRDTNWSDDAIQKMDDEKLSAYEVAVKHISKRIRDGRMDALALINLVGERKIVNKSGKSFGTQGKNGNEEKVKEALLKEVDKQCALLKPHRTMDHDKVSEQLAGYTFTTEELKAAFGPTGLKGEERMLFFSLIDCNITDEKVMHQLTGMKEKDIEHLRKECQGRFSKYFDAAIHEMADKLENSPELQEKLKLAKDEVEKIVSASREAQEQGKHVEDVLQKEDGKAVKTALSDYIMDAKEKDPTFWQRVVKRSREVLKKPAEVKKADKHDEETFDHKNYADDFKRDAKDELLAKSRDRDISDDLDTDNEKIPSGNWQKKYPKSSSREMENPYSVTRT